MPLRVDVTRSGLIFLRDAITAVGVFKLLRWLRSGNLSLARPFVAYHPTRVAGP
jgi:hypothetical protein